MPTTISHFSTRIQIFFSFKTQVHLLYTHDCPEHGAVFYHSPYHSLEENWHFPFCCNPENLGHLLAWNHLQYCIFSTDQGNKIRNWYWTVILLDTLQNTRVCSIKLNPSNYYSHFINKSTKMWQ